MPHTQTMQFTQPYSGPSNTHSSLISGPLPPAVLCLDKLLTHLVSLNGTIQLTHEDNILTPPEPSPPTTSTSLDSLCSLPSYTNSTDSDKESTSDHSTISTTSNRQLCPQLPISYNETLLKRLPGCPQVRMMNMLSIPLPDTDTEEDEEGMDTT